MNKKETDLSKVVKRERTFATQAAQEGKGAAKRAKAEARAGLTESAKDSRWETKIDNMFAAVRRKKADIEAKKLKSR